MDRPALTRRLAVLNCPHPAMMAQHLRGNPRQLARSWYMFFFQIPWLPEFLLGRGHAWPIARAIRRSTVRQDAITDDDLIRAARRGHALGRAAQRAQLLSRRVPRPRERRLLRRPRCNGSSTATSRCRRPRHSLADWPTIAAPTLLIWGEQDVALGKELTVGMEPLFSGPFEVRYIPDSGHWVQQEQPALVNQWLAEFLG